MGKSLKHGWVHLGRVAVLAGILVVMHLQHERLLLSRHTVSLEFVDLDRVKRFLPLAVKLGDAERHGGRDVVAEDGSAIGYVVQTAPESNVFLGFSGPTNLVIVFHPDDRIAGIDILESRDTRDHVELIRKDPGFFASWIGLSWAEASGRTRVDGVSGATLTSMAMVQGIQRRLGAVNVSTKFAKPLELKDAASFFQQAVRIEQDKQIRSLWHAFDASQQKCGAILRSSPAADEVIGYQGPTETRIAIRADGSIAGIAIADSFDNEPYVGYVRSDEGYSDLLKKYTIQEWSGLDLKKEGIEGVSGATMTSMAVAQGLVATARQFESEQRAIVSNRSQGLSVIGRSVGTVAVILAGLVIGLTSLRGNAKIRVCFQVLLIAYLGFCNGDLLSLAMFVGWAQSGIPWPNAIGLVMLALAAFALPITMRTNLYCSHLCPHGAVQQLLPRRWKWQQPLSAHFRKCLLWIRPLLLVWVVLVGYLSLPFSLVDVEPFDAYLWRAAAWPTIVIAVFGIVASFKIPMAYCRFGCATGAVLDYVRRHSRSDRLTRADLFAFVCFVLGVFLYLVQLPK